MGELESKRILVIDDDPGLRHLLAQILSRGGARVFTASSGQQGLHLLRHAARPDLVILDIMMPGMDGWQVYSRISQLSDVPIMFLTVMDAEEDIVRGLDYGAVDYVTKPFSLENLLTRIQTALHGAAQGSAREASLPL